MKSMSLSIKTNKLFCKTTLHYYINSRFKKYQHLYLRVHKTLILLAEKLQKLHPFPVDKNGIYLQLQFKTKKEYKIPRSLSELKPQVIRLLEIMTGLGNSLLNRSLKLSLNISNEMDKAKMLSLST